jgi:murein L,D-transpeptidase YcbB/YkuD
MYNRRYRILAGTALALILAAPLVGMAKNSSQIGAVPMAAPPAEQAVPESAPATATPANEAPAASNGAVPAAASPVEPTVAPDPLASLDPADRAVAQNIRDLLAARADKLFAGKKERAAVEAFYQNRNFAPLWLDKALANARAGSVIARLKDADADGLDPGEYRTPNFAGLAPDALAEAELRLTRVVLTYARHVQAGRFPYTRVSRNIELPQAAPEPADVLGNIANAADAGKTLDLYSPQNEPYRKLKAKLADEETNVAVQRQRLGAATAEIEDAKRSTSKTIDIQTKYAELDRDYGSIERTYQSLLQGREAARMSQAVDDQAQAFAFRVVEAPQRALFPSGPNRPLFNSLVLLAGFAGGLAAAVFLSLLSGRVNAGDDLVAEFGVPVIGVFTKLRKADDRRQLQISAATLSASIALLLICYVGVIGVLRTSIYSVLGA